MAENKGSLLAKSVSKHASRAKEKVGTNINCGPKKKNEIYSNTIEMLATRYIYRERGQNAYILYAFRTSEREN